MPPTIREQNLARTKRAILRSAQTLFGTHGYTETGVREIAAKARVNQALISRYFGSKLELFAVALETSLDVSVFTSLRRDMFGEVLAEAFCESQASTALTVPMLVFAVGDTEARKVALTIFTRVIAEPLAQWFGTAEAEDRAAQVIAFITGIYTYRLILPLAPFSNDPSEGMREWVASTLQDVVDR